MENPIGSSQQKAVHSIGICRNLTESVDSGRDNFFWNKKKKEVKIRGSLQCYYASDKI